MSAKRWLLIRYRSHYLAQTYKTNKLVNILKISPDIRSCTHVGVEAVLLLPSNMLQARLHSLRALARQAVLCEPCKY